jgi:hypothetical protein
VTERDAAALCVNDAQGLTLQGDVGRAGRGHAPERFERGVTDRRAGSHELE